MSGRVLLGLVAALALGYTTDAAGADERAAPLSVPTDPLPSPEGLAGVDFAARVDAAATAFRARGYGDLPVLARALLGSDERGVDPRLAERATALAPASPGVAYEVARRLRRPLEGVRALGLVPGSFPAVVWMLAWGGAALGLGMLAAAGLLAALVFARTATLHGHALAHGLGARQPTAWPGVIAGVTALAALPLFGVGPAVVLAASAALGMTRLSLGEAAAVGALVTGAGLLLGEPLVDWARVASHPAHAPELMAAWRVERGPPLPGDFDELERALARAPDDLVRLALATAAKRAGDLARAEALSTSLSPGAAAPLRARAANFVGVAALARGDAPEAIAAFDRARRDEGSAAVLYNLSQAHGRALHLADQSSLFAAARSLDPDLVRRQTAHASLDIHEYLAESPIPVGAYLRRALAPAPEAEALALAVRRALLGPVLPDGGWLALPGLALLGLVLRRSGITRCPRCLRVACERCSGPAQGDECVRCARLFDPTVTIDARVRREQIDRDRRAQRWLARALGLVGAVLPGAAAILQGRVLRGSLALLVAGIAAAAWLAAPHAPAPAEVGRLAREAPASIAALLAAPLWLGAVAGSLRRAARGGAR